jgi:hypothetical protein
LCAFYDGMRTWQHLELFIYLTPFCQFYFIPFNDNLPYYYYYLFQTTNGILPLALALQQDNTQIHISYADKI